MSLYHFDPELGSWNEPTEGKNLENTIMKPCHNSSTFTSKGKNKLNFIIFYTPFLHPNQGWVDNVFLHKTNAASLCLKMVFNLITSPAGSASGLIIKTFSLHWVKPEASVCQLCWLLSPKKQTLSGALRETSVSLSLAYCSPFIGNGNQKGWSCLEILIWMML